MPITVEVAAFTEVIDKARRCGAEPSARLLRLRSVVIPLQAELGDGCLSWIDLVERPAIQVVTLPGTVDLLALGGGRDHEAEDIEAHFATVAVGVHHFDRREHAVVESCLEGDGINENAAGVAQGIRARLHEEVERVILSMVVLLKASVYLSGR